jgi:hypothetical protein
MIWTDVLRSKITLDPHGPSSISGVRATGARPRLLFSLLEPIAQYLPRAISFTGSDHDLGSALLGDDLRQAALRAIGEERYLTVEELGALEKRLGRVVLKGTASACPVGSLGWNQSLAIQEGRPVEPIHQGQSRFKLCSLVFSNLSASYKEI